MVIEGDGEGCSRDRREKTSAKIDIVIVSHLHGAYEHTTTYMEPQSMHTIAHSRAIVRSFTKSDTRPGVHLHEVVEVEI